MAKNGKNKIRTTTKNSANTLFLWLNIAALLVVAWQAYSFFASYNGTQQKLEDKGRIMAINPVTDEVTLNDLTPEELEKLRDKARQVLIKDAAEEDTTEEADEDTVKNAPEQAEAPKPMNYNSANLAVVITELGMKQAELDLAKALPKEVSFAFSPYSDNLQKKIDDAYKEGRETLLNIMVQPVSFPLKDNGPLAIQSTLDETTNLRRLEQTMGLATVYKGLLVTDGDTITGASEKFIPVMKKVTESGKFIGYFRSGTNSVTENDAKPLSTDIFAVDILADAEPSEAQILDALNRVKQALVLEKKRVVVAIRPNPVSIATVKKWLEENTGPNVQLAPVSYFVTDN